MGRLGTSLLIALAVTACLSSEPGGTSGVHETVVSVESTTTPAVSPALVGRWERAEGTYTSLDGMIVEIQSDGLTGVIVAMPENPHQFQVGDEKWANIEATDEGAYSFDDLVREENTGAISHVEGVNTVGPDGNTLQMTFPTTGTSQGWVRVDD